MKISSQQFSSTKRDLAVLGAFFANHAKSLLTSALTVSKRLFVCFGRCGLILAGLLAVPALLADDLDEDFEQTVFVNEARSRSTRGVFCKSRQEPSDLGSHGLKTPFCLFRAMR